MKTDKQIRRIFFLFAATVLLGWVAAGCDEEDDAISSDPYAGGKAPLGIKFSTAQPVPANGYPGDEIRFSVKGLQAWSGVQNGEYPFEFFISDEKAEVISLSDTTVTILVPSNVSSGLSSIVMNDQIFFGPRFEVLGNVSIDNTYLFTSAHHSLGRSGAIYCYLPHRTLAGNIYVGGAFNRIITGTSSAQTRNGLAMLNEKGALIGNNTAEYKVNYQVLGDTYILYNGDYIRSMSRFSDGKVLISGKMTIYDKTGMTNPPVFNVCNMTVANADFSPWTETVNVIPIGLSTVSTAVTYCFNGGTEEIPARTFVTSDDRVIAVGNLKTYRRIDYDNSGAMNYYASYEYEDVASVACMDRTGALIPEYHQGGIGANYFIRDAAMDPDDGVIIVGEFTEFDGIPAARIVRLDASGTVDQAFLSNVGTGANGTISMIRYNPTLGKIALTGQFTSFDGRSCNGIAILNADGTQDDTFVQQEMLGGRPNFTSILNDGKVVVSGTFNKYAGVTRNGFLILDPDGTAAQAFNVPGKFTGQLYEVVETTTSVGNNGLLLLGDFTRFNDHTVKNVVMLETDF